MTHINILNIHYLFLEQTEMILDVIQKLYNPSLFHSHFQIIKKKNYNKPPIGDMPKYLHNPELSVIETVT